MGGSGSKVIVNDKGLTKIFKEAGKFGGKAVAVGFFAGEKEEGGASLPTIAAVQEYGADIPVTPRMRAFFGAIGHPLKASTNVIHIPERSFLRGWVMENKDRIEKAMAALLKKVQAGEMEAQKALEMLGQFAVGGVQKKIKDGPFTPLSGLTIERKGSSRPLIDTGALVNGVHSEVRSVEGGGA